MKNKILIILFYFIFLLTKVNAENILIEAKNISFDKDKVTSVFENDVVIKSKEKTIKGDYVKYNKELGYLLIKNNITVYDNNNNVIKADYAEYFEKDKILRTTGLTSVTTSENYSLEGSNITVDSNKKIINSNTNSIIKDQDGNKISLENFEYLSEENIFKSIGLVKVEDKNKNIYEFSQVYIDTKKKEVLGTDIKSYLNSQNFKSNTKNNPRIFANSVSLSKEKSSFNKSVFTICEYRENDKCPPWTVQSTKMLHDNKTKTIHYDNAIIKVYNIPIFYLPRLSHPDPSVKRRSGFLPPTFYNTKNLGEAISIPYFFNLGKDKNLTITNRIYASENPLFQGEYHQAFKNSNFLSDFSFTEGYKKTNSTKKSGQKSHFFSKFVKNFKGESNSNNTFSVITQNISNNKYLKLYKIKSNLTDYSQDSLENSINFSHESDEYFFGFNSSIYETLQDNYNDKYEYVLPEIIFDKNLINSQKFGSINLQSNYKVRNYDTNKLSNFFINDLDWVSKNLFFNSGVNSNFLGNLKNINYEVKNIDLYKDDLTNELRGALGFLSKLKLQKNHESSNHFLTPKMLLRYSPGSMRKETNGNRLNPLKAFSLDRLSNINNYETGLSATLGFDYKIKKNDKNFDFSVAQIINEKENKKMADKTSLNEKLSDLVGTTSYNLNKNIKLNYNFSLDQNYNDFNYNEIETKINYGSLGIDFNYLKENKHIGNQDYFKTKLSVKKDESGLFTFETKRNLVTNSAEFYNLSYEYINDCLRAGLVYRREFYNDSEIEPDNSLMFKITLVPLGDVNTPKINQ